MTKEGFYKGENLPEKDSQQDRVKGQIVDKMIMKCLLSTERVDFTEKRRRRLERERKRKENNDSLFEKSGKMFVF